MEDNTQTPAQQDGIQPTTGTDAMDTATPEVTQAAATEAPTAPAPSEEREYPAMTMEDILASEAQEPQSVSRGDIVDGTDRVHRSGRHCRRHRREG